MLLKRHSKGVVAAALGLALLVPQSKADQPKGSNPPAPAKTVVPKTAKDTGKTVKDAKKVAKGTSKKTAKDAKTAKKAKMTKPVAPAKPDIRDVRR